MRDEGIIKECTKHDDGYSISLEGGICFYLLFENYNGPLIPKVGDKILLHSYGGSGIRGIDLNDINLYYKSDNDLENDRKKWLAKYEKQKKEDFEKNKHKLDKDFNSLPDFFQKRITKFRNNNPKFRVDYESYEMFCCTEAVKIAKKLKTPEKVKEFVEKQYPMDMVPSIDNGHSGNTIGCAAKLAYIYLSDPTYVSKMHGALSPIVGSKEYKAKNKRTSIFKND